MDGFFAYLGQNKTGIFVFIICLFSLMFLVKWFASIFALGRYKPAQNVSASGQQSSPSYTSIGYIFADLAVKIINDFRHLLALVIVGIFGLTLAYVLYTSHGLALKDSLQAVIAAFGGIVGTIIGYYFGESAAKGAIANAPAVSDATNDTEVAQGVGNGSQPNMVDTDAVIPVAPPPVKDGKVESND